MNLPGLGAPHPGGLLLPGAVGQAPWLYPPVPLPAAAPPPQQQVQQHAQQQQHKPANEMSERDVRLLKRKQANRDSARRSKLKKKQETEELVVKRTQLSELHNNLIKRVREAQARVRQLQDTNSGLKQQYTTLLCATEGCAG